MTTPSGADNITDEPAKQPAWCVWALGAIVILMALRPGDATFIVDEPSLLALAQYWNHHPSELLGIHFPFSPAIVSLQGSHALYYGPVAVWVYQIFELFTLNPIALTSMHAILFGVVTGAALLWLSRSMRVSPALAVVAMLSPWLWFYFRQLWDNSFCIPLSAVTVAAYADFLLTRRPGSLRLAMAAAALMPLVHFMSLALVVPLAIHLIFFQTRWLRRYGWSVLAIMLGINAAGWQYWAYLCTHHAAVDQGFMPDSAWQGWVFPLLGGGHLSAAGLGDILGDDWSYMLPMPWPFVVRGAESISMAAHLAVWAGMIIAVGKAWRVLVRPAEASAVDHLALLALLVFTAQTLLDGIGRVYGQPHYFNATWIAYAVFVWMAADALWQHFWKRSVVVRWALPVYAMSLAIVIGTAEFKIARDGGTLSDHYGTVLSQQVAAARRIKQFGPGSHIYYLFDQWGKFPDTPQRLGWWVEPAGPEQEARKVVVKYRDGFAGDAGIVVQDFPL